MLTRSLCNKVATTGLLAAALLLTAPLLAFDLEKGPYLQALGGESVMVVWETRDSVSGHVRYGASTALGQRSADSPSGQHHELVISGLSAGQRYHYALYEGDAVRSELYDFRTDAGPSQPFRFIVYGDNRSDAVAHQKVVDAMLTEPDVAFVVNTGDAVSSGEIEEQWTEFFNIERELLARVPVFPTIGNHEEDDGEVPIWERLFVLPTLESGTEHYYLTRWGNSALLVLDGHVEIEPWYLCLLRAMAFDGCFSEDQLDFVATAMQAVQADPAIEHLFVITHAGPYSSKSGRTGNAQMRDLLPSFLDHGVKVIFSGHDHYFEHGISGNGIDYVVTGGGGAPLYAADPGSSNFLIPHEPLVSLSLHHYVVVDVNGDTVQVTIKTPEGDILDQFTAGQRHSCGVPADCSNATPGACPGNWSCEDSSCRWVCDPAPSCDVPSDCPAPPAGYCPGEWRCSLHQCDWACSGGECISTPDCASLPALNDCPGGHFVCTDEVCEWVCPAVDAGVVADAAVETDAARIDATQSGDASVAPDASNGGSDAQVSAADAAASATAADAAGEEPPPPTEDGCGCQAAGAAPGSVAWLLLGFLVVRLRRRIS